MLSDFMPGCRWVIVDSRSSGPYAAANDRENVVRVMRAVPEADRAHLWVIDRLAGDRAPFDQPYNRKASYGWRDEAK